MGHDLGAPGAEPPKKTRHPELEKTPNQSSGYVTMFWGLLQEILHACHNSNYLEFDQLYMKC